MKLKFIDALKKNNFLSNSWQGTWRNSWCNSWNNSWQMTKPVDTKAIVAIELCNSWWNSWYNSWWNSWFNSWQSQLTQELLLLLNYLTVSDIVFDTVHVWWTQNPNNAPGPGGCQERLAVIRVVRPGTGVKVFIGIRVGVALQQLIISIGQGFINGHSVVSNGCEDHRIIFTKIMITTHTEDGLKLIIKICHFSLVLKFWHTCPWSSFKNPTHLKFSFGLRPGWFGPLRRPRPLFREFPMLFPDPVPTGVSLLEVVSEIDVEPMEDV